MLPLIDMCNHSFDSNCEVKPLGGSLALVTSRQVQLCIISLRLRVCSCLVFA